MAWWRRRRSRTNARTVAVPAANFAVVRDTDGDVTGFWFADPRHARNRDLVDAVLARHDLWHLVGASYRVVSNTVDDRGGLFVLFTPPGSGATTPSAVAQDPEGDVTAPRTLEVNDRTYPLHEDFEAFSRDAAEGRIALLKTTIAGLSMDDQSRLFAVLAARFGPDAPETRAIVHSGFHCLTCFRRYSMTRLLVRDHLNRGGWANVRDITACVACGGQEAVWIYDPSLRGPS
jgi:hypothetical protein